MNVKVCACTERGFLHMEAVSAHMCLSHNAGFEAVGVRCAKLQGAMKKSEKERTLKLLAAGEIDVIIGTHALVQEHVEFHALALVVVDEQHRFGVAQRLSLIAKANDGHFIRMCANTIDDQLLRK